MTNESLVSLFISQQNSEETKQTYLRGLRVFSDFIGSKPLTSVSDVDVVAWKKALDDSGLKPSSRFTRWTAARSFFDWLTKTGRIPFSPFAAVKAPKKVKNQSPIIPTNDEFRLILNSVEHGTTRGVRDKAILHLLGTGLRVSEVSSLRLDDYQAIEGTEDRVVKIVGKGMKERYVPLSVSTEEAIEGWLNVRCDDSDYLFTDTSGGPMTRKQVQTAFRRAAVAAGVRGLSPHKFRHHYATRLIRAGANVFAVQQLLGHESVSTTQVYVNIDMSDKLEAAKLDTVL